MAQGFETQDPIVQARVRAKVAPLRSLRRRFYTLHLPGQDSIVLEVDTHSNQVIAGPPGYVGANMAHVSARHGGRKGVWIEEHPLGEMPTAALARNVGYRDPTPEPARPPQVREAEEPVGRGALRQPLTFHELGLPSGARLVLGANAEGKVVRGPNPLLGGDLRQVLASHLRGAGATHRQYPPGEAPPGWDRHPLHGSLEQSDLELGPRTTEDAYDLSMLQAHRPDPPVPEGLSHLSTESGEPQRPETGAMAPRFNPRDAVYRQAAQDVGNLERPMYEHPAGRWGFSLPERAHLERVKNARNQAGALYEEGVLRPGQQRAVPQADSRTPGLLNPLRGNLDEGAPDAALPPPLPPGAGTGGGAPAASPPSPPLPPPRGAPRDPTTGSGPAGHGRPGPLALLPRRAAGSKT